MTLDDYLKLDRCPHCGVDRPNLRMVAGDINTSSDTGVSRKIWRIYQCGRCGNLVTAGGFLHNSRLITETYPSLTTVNDVLPDKVKAYLQQAIDSSFAPSGSVMLCASAVDAMLKTIGYKDGKLYSRIEKAAKDNIITPDMSKWAHQVRLDANDERHADEDSIMPTVDDAKQAIEFTTVLAELLFVLPSKVTRGLEASTHQAN